jgi:NTP pyrophosphatase (non-canonical NTP hydrolase)
MKFSEMQADLRHFAAERDWQQFHTPKNLSTALMVEAAELAEIFQWMTPDQSLAATFDPDGKQRISDEVADVLLYCSWPTIARSTSRRRPRTSWHALP